MIEKFDGEIGYRYIKPSDRAKDLGLGGGLRRYLEENLAEKE